MKAKDNHDHTLLVLSDYLEETNQIQKANELRESINNNKTIHWCYEYQSGVGGVVVGAGVGGVGGGGGVVVGGGVGGVGVGGGGGVVVGGVGGVVGSDVGST